MASVLQQSFSRRRGSSYKARTNSPAIIHYGPRIACASPGRIAPGKYPEACQTVQDLAELIRNYYGRDAVRERILEFLGPSSTNGATATYVCGTDGESDPCALEPLPVGRIDELLRRGCEIGRSLWDRKFLIADLDIDYENFDSAGEAYVNPDRTFHILQPVVDAAIEFLRTAGVHPLHLISGRGHHLVWAIHYESPAFSQLAALGNPPPSLMMLYDRCAVEFGQALHPSIARAFAGLGMLLEFVAHRILEMAAPRCSVPIQVTLVEVGPVGGRREIVSLDISEYGDPLHLRHIRAPFSVYLKPRGLAWCLGHQGVRQLLPLFEIPLSGMPIQKALCVRGNAEATLELAEGSPVRIPDESEASLNLLREYKNSDLAEFHERFYSCQSKTAVVAELSSDAHSPDVLPACTRLILDHPNDWLLKPGGIQHVTRTLMALSWSPQEIVDIIRTKYLEDFGWKDRWLRYDAASRALFYVRLFSGLIDTGQDQLIDFNCVSHQEKGYCTVPDCTLNLVPYQQALLRRRQHG